MLTCSWSGFKISWDLSINNSFPMETSIRHVKIFPDKFRTSSEILSDLYIADNEFEYNFGISSPKKACSF